MPKACFVEPKRNLSAFLLLLLAFPSPRSQAPAAAFAYLAYPSPSTSTSTSESISNSTSTFSMPAVTIGIAGGTGAGKSTLARAVYDSLGHEHCAYLMHDSYYKDISHLSFEERAATNFDHPDSVDTELLVEHVKSLKAGLSIEVPNYDFSTHSRTDEVTVVEPRKVVLVEGILIFSDPKLVEEMGIKVFVEADSDVRLMRRISRDTAERGRSVDEVLAQYSETVRPMHEEFVEPSKLSADIIVQGGNSTLVALGMITSYLRHEAGLLVDAKAGQGRAGRGNEEL